MFFKCYLNFVRDFVPQYTSLVDSERCCPDSKIRATVTFDIFSEVRYFLMSHPHTQWVENFVIPDCDELPVLVLYFVGVFLLIGVSAHAGLREVGDQVEVVLEKRKWCCSSRVTCAVKSIYWVVLMRNIYRKGWAALCFCFLIKEIYCCT